MKFYSDLAEISAHFKFAGEFIGAEPHYFGHINDTYVVYVLMQDGSQHRYILQRVNHLVFKQPVEVMSNILAITTHLRRKIEYSGGNTDREALTLVPTKDGNIFFRTDEGDYWRAYKFISGARTYLTPQSLDHVYNAGRAYGNFQLLLADFPIDQLYETIQNFHNTPQRMKTFLDVVRKDKVNRANAVKEEIDIVLQRTGKLSILVDFLKSGDLPLRVTHNDTKYSNVMIDDQTGQGICIIDLDTVMPGTILYDFGDAIRSITNTGDEDERTLSQVNFSIERFARYTQGYLETIGSMLTPVEFGYLVFSAWLMTLECGMRFLGDYLSGDIYFKVQRENHNLDRCRTQFKLVTEIESQWESMQRIVDRYK